MSITDAAQFAAEHHEGQFRKYNGKPYITHVIRVAGRVATHDRATVDLVCAAYLHDVVEDCGVSIETISTKFGVQVANYVRHLTNEPKVEGVSRSAKQLQDRERLRSVPDECKVVKLIDRIDNLNDLDYRTSFADMYAGESRLLLECLKGVDSNLEAELLARIDEIEEYHNDDGDY